MLTRPLGRTGLIVTRLGLGTAALGRPGYINIGHGTDLADGRDVATMRARSDRVIDEALAAGIRYFDAARSYGRAEVFLAGRLNERHISPQDVVVGSKWGYVYTADWRVDAEKHEVKDHSAANLRRQFLESRAILGDLFHLYQIHSATFETGVLADRDVHAELARLKADGIKIGLSLSGPKQADTLRAALEVSIDGVRLFDCVQATWNILEPSVRPALVEASSAGLGVIIKEALANGRLTDRNADPRFAPRARILAAHAARLGTTVDGLALAAALAQPWADVVLSGASTLEQLESNLGALDVRWDDEAAKALAALCERPDVYWSVRAALPWN